MTTIEILKQRIARLEMLAMKYPKYAQMYYKNIEDMKKNMEAK